MNLKKVLIVLTALAVLLGIAAVFVVFYNPETLAMPGTSTSSTSLFAVMRNNNTNTRMIASGSVPGLNNAFIGNTSSSASSSQPNAPQFASSYSSPYPLQWTEGKSTLVITDTAIQGNQLILGVTVQTGNDAECIPMNMRLVMDESGNLETPTPQQFSFPDTNDCNGTPNTAYDAQAISFTLGQNLNTPFLLTTGGTSNIFFEVATTTDGGISVTLPVTSG